MGIPSLKLGQDTSVVCLDSSIFEELCTKAFHDMLGLRFKDMCPVYFVPSFFLILGNHILDDISGISHMGFDIMSLIDHNKRNKIQVNHFLMHG